MRVAVFWLLASSQALAAPSRGYLEETIADTRGHMKRITHAYEEDIYAAEAKVDRTRAARDQAMARADEQMRTAEAGLATAYQATPRSRSPRGRRLDLVTREVTPELVARLGAADKNGALVAKIKVDSEAYIAGLRAGDIIQVFDGLHVMTADDLDELGKRVERRRKLYVEVWRDGQQIILGLPAVEDRRVKRARARLEQTQKARQDIEASHARAISVAEGELADLRREYLAQLAEAKRDLDALEEQLGGINARFGLKFTAVPADVARYFDVSGGAYVTNVELGTRASDTGLLPNDIVLRFADTEVTGARHLAELLRAARASESVTVEVLRNGKMNLMMTPGGLDT